VDAAFAEGKIGWTKAREILRVATPETEAAWVDRATTVSSRTLEHQVARSVQGDLPPDSLEQQRAPQRRRVTFDMSSEDAKALFAALAILRQQSGVSDDEVDDSTLLATLAARVLHEAGDTTAPSAERYRVLIEHCPRCGRTEGADSEVDELAVGEAQCDAELVDLRSGSSHGHATRTIPPATRRAVLARDRYQCVVPGCRNRLWLDIHHLVGREHGGMHTLANLVSLCTVHHRMAHAEQLVIWRDGDTLHFRFANGRTASRHSPVPDPRGSRSKPATGGASSAGDELGGQAGEGLAPP
jgi:hypothetical protein